MQVDDVAHEAEATQLDVAGYRSCLNEHCGELILLELSWRTGGYCLGCFHDLHGSSIAEVEIRSKARTMSLNSTKQKQKLDKGNRATKQASTNAAKRALDRLKHLFPDLYDILLAEERARFGLDPFPYERAIKQPDTMTPSEIIDFARVYDSLDEHGVDVNVFDVPTS